MNAWRGSVGSFWYLRLWIYNEMNGYVSSLLVHMHSRRLKLQLSQTALPQLCFEIILLKANLLGTDPCRRVHVDSVAG